MERLFFCCFRSCLKGDDEKEFYTILEIEDPRRATTDQIKRQYKKLSLSLHPDKLAQKGIEVTAEHRQKFIRLKEAYDVLSDPKRRRLYDEYGETGLKLMENPADLNHTQLLRNFQKNRGDRTTLTLAIATIFAIVLILPILFSLKCDGTLNDDAKWVAIWTPMWVIDALLLLSAAMLIFDQGSQTHGAGEDEENGSSPNSDKIPFHEKLIHFTTTILFILIQIFVLIRLDDYTDWSWFAVFAPWFAYEGVGILAALPIAFKTLTPPNSDDFGAAESLEEGNEEVFMQKMQAETEYFEKLLEQDREKRYILVHGLRIWLAVFLALQLDDIVDWNWGLVLLPIWVYLFMHYIYAFIYRMWANEKMKGIDASNIETGLVNDPLEIVKYQQASILSSSSFFLCFGQCAPLFMSIMLVCRLESGSYSTFLIILPIFLMIGCCCCFVCFAILGMSMVDADSLEEEMRQAGNNNASNPEGNTAGEKDQYHPPVNTADPEYGTFSNHDITQSSPMQEMNDGHGTYQQPNAKDAVKTTASSNANNNTSISQGIRKTAENDEKEKLVNENTIDLDID